MRVYRNAELVVRFYEFIGLMPESGGTAPFGSNASSLVKEAMKYEPNDFAQNQRINEQLAVGAELGDQQMIMFDEKDI